MGSLGYYIARNFIIYTGHVMLGWLNQEIKEGRLGWACKYDGKGRQRMCTGYWSANLNETGYLEDRRKLKSKISFFFIS